MFISFLKVSFLCTATFKTLQLSVISGKVKDLNVDILYFQFIFIWTDLNHNFINQKVRPQRCLLSLSLECLGERLLCLWCVLCLSLERERERCLSFLSRRSSSRCFLAFLSSRSE